MMYAVNVISAVYLAVGMFLSGEGLEAVGFVQRHPYVMLNILIFGLASAIGQVRVHVLLCLNNSYQELRAVLIFGVYTCH